MKICDKCHNYMAPLTYENVYLCMGCDHEEVMTCEESDKETDAFMQSIREAKARQETGDNETQ